MSAPLAAITRVLVTPEGHIETGGCPVQLNVAGANPPRHAARVLDVAALHIAGQTVGRVIGHGDGFVFGVVGQHDQHGAEDLLARDAHLVVDLGKYGRAHEIPGLQALGFARSAGEQLGPRVDTGLNQALNLLVLNLRDHRPHPGLGMRRVAHRHRLGNAPRDRFRLGQARARHEHARGRITGLPRVVHHVQHAAGDRGFEVSVIQNEVGRLAAQFLRHALYARRRIHCHLRSRAGGAGERHHVHIRVPGQRGAHAGASAVDQIEHTGRDARLVHDLGPHLRREGRDLAGFQHHRATHGQRGRDLAGNLIHRPVPGRDQSAHADGFAHHAMRAEFLLEGVAAQHLQGLFKMAQTAVGLVAVGQRFRRAHLRADGIGHIPVARFIHLDTTLKQRDARGAGTATVALEGRLRCRHGAVDIGLGAHGNARADRGVGGVDDVQRAGHKGVYPLAVEVKLEVFTHAYGLPWGR